MLVEILIVHHQQQASKWWCWWKSSWSTRTSRSPGGSDNRRPPSPPPEGLKGLHEFFHDFLLSLCVPLSQSLSVSLSLFLKVQPPEQGNTWSISPEGRTAQATLLTPVNLLSLSDSVPEALDMTSKILKANESNFSLLYWPGGSA